MKTSTKTKAIKSRRTAWLLRKAGYKIKSVEPNRMQPEYDVYIFDIVPGFQEELDKIIKETLDFKINKK